MENYFYRKLVFAKSKSSGTSNYADLANKPQINGVTLNGNKTSEDLGIVGEEELTQALAAESAARQKQDDLLQGEIEGKIAAANILAGNGIDISQEGNNVTINSTVQPKTYTAGTNIEITEDNVINNIIPYKENIEGNVINLGQSTNPNNNDNNINIGLDVTNNSSNSVSVGNNTILVGTNNILIGNNSFMQHQNSIVIGHNASTSMQNQFAIGSDFMPIKEIRFNSDNTTRIQVTDFVNVINNLKTVTMSDNQLSLGSTAAPINEMKVVTSEGAKYIATTDQTVPAGGTTGQVLMKNSNTDYDFSWTSLANYDEVSF